LTRSRLLLVVAAAVLAVGAIVLTAGGRVPWPASEGCDIPETVTGKTPPSSAEVAPGGGGVHVLDQGFTQSEVDGSVSLGAVVENTSSSVAYRTRVIFELFDDGHHPLPESSPSQSRLTVEIPTILPGQRIGIGNSARPAGDARVAAITAQPDTTIWLAREAIGKDFASVTAVYLRTERPNPTAAHNVDVHYQETSTNCRSLTSREAAVVFHDSGGRIVGGALADPGGLVVFRDDHGAVVGGERHLPSSPPCASGARELWVVPLTQAPATAVDSRTEIYPYCDLAPSPDSGKPGQHAN
jgi:hypothetical protein